VAEGKFGFIPENEEPAPDLALQFEPTPVDRPAHSLLESDRLAETAGFASRERGSPIEASIMQSGKASASPPPEAMRRRRVNREHATRALAIRMTETQFARFLRYADRHELTYSDTIAHLLDIAGEPC
jgi:hypothetical protein